MSKKPEYELPFDHPLRTVNIKQAAELIQLSEYVIRERLRQGRFPKPLEHKPGTLLWFWKDIEKWARAERMKEPKALAGIRSKEYLDMMAEDDPDVAEVLEQEKAKKGKHTAD